MPGLTHLSREGKGRECAHQVLSNAITNCWVLSPSVRERAHSVPSNNHECQLDYCRVLSSTRIHAPLPRAPPTTSAQPLRTTTPMGASAGTTFEHPISIVVVYGTRVHKPGTSSTSHTTRSYKCTKSHTNTGSHHVRAALEDDHADGHVGRRPVREEGPPRGPADGVHGQLQKECVADMVSYTYKF